MLLRTMSLKSKTRITNKHSNVHCNLLYGYDIIKKQVKVPVSSFFVYISTTNVLVSFIVDKMLGRHNCSGN